MQRACEFLRIGFSFYAREDNRSPNGIRDQFLSSFYDTQRLAPLSTRSLYQPAACSTSIRSVNSQAAKSALLQTRTAASFGTYHNSYYCFTWFNCFGFRRLYPARLSTRRYVPQKDLLLMALTFGMALDFVFFNANRGLLFAFHD